jgi:hypothetical protein
VLEPAPEPPVAVVDLLTEHKTGILTMLRSGISSAPIIAPPTLSPPPQAWCEHIRLKPLGDDQRVAVPGMADFSGGGPAGTYCRDCDHFADAIAVQTGIDAIERTRAGCAMWAQEMAHAAPSPRRDIRLCRSCKHFAEAADASPRCFIIDFAGMSYRLDSMPEDLRGWLLQKQKRDAH